MASRNVTVIILCEDTQHEVFIRQWLEQVGFQKRKFRVEKNTGQGAGDQFVRNKYPNEIKELRRVNTFRPEGVSLVTAIDADTHAVTDRHNELDRALRDAQLEPRQNGEKIAILIPKRNIETWIHHLQGSEVNEDDIYRKLEKPSDCAEDVRQFCNSAPTTQIIITAPPSLQMALAEMQRII